MTKTSRPITDIEWLMVQKLRTLCDKQYGVLRAQVKKSKITELDLTVYHDINELEELQK